MKMYFNGVLVSSDPFTGSYADLKAVHTYLGKESYNADQLEGFQGQMDEVRVWQVARTAEEIRGGMTQSITGSEADLVALWNFEGGLDGVVTDLGPGGHHGKLMGDAKQAPAPRPDQPPPPPKIGRVLDLDGEGSYVQFPDGSFEDLTEVTVEGWVNWRTFRNSARAFDLTVKSGRFSVELAGTRPVLILETWEGDERRAVETPELLPLYKWVHVAATGTSQYDLKLYLNGVLASGPLVREQNFDYRNSECSRFNLLGGSNAKVVWPGDAELDGQLDEVRVWNRVLTPEEIAAGMSKTLGGDETGLVGYWNFDDPDAPLRDLSPGGRHGQFVGKAQAVPRSPPSTVQPLTSLVPFEIEPGEEQVLALSGHGSALRLPAGILDGLREVTIEGWVFWGELGEWRAPWFFGAGESGRNHKLAMFTSDDERQNRLAVYLDDRKDGGEWKGQMIFASGPPALGKWIHQALVISAEEGARLYLDGQPVVSNPDLNLSLLEANRDNQLGQNGFVGLMDEVRLWKVARTAEQIRAGIHRKLTGKEEGLLALWNFDVVEGMTVPDASPNGNSGVLEGSARVAGSNPPTQGDWGALQGRVTDAKGRPPRGGSEVTAWRGEQQLGLVQTEPGGRYWIAIPSPQKPFEVRVIVGEEIAVKTGLSANPGELVDLDLMMPELDGFGFMEGFRKLPGCRHVPVIVITAKDITDEDRARLNGEVTRILRKTAHSPEELLAEIRSFAPPIADPTPPC